MAGNAVGLGIDSGDHLEVWSRTEQDRTQTTDLTASGLLVLLRTEDAAYVSVPGADVARVERAVASSNILLVLRADTDFFPTAAQGTA